MSSPSNHSGTVTEPRRLRDPHVDPAMREKTAHDPEVYVHVMSTSGAYELLFSLRDFVRVGTSLTRDSMAVAIGCGGGRHRAPALAIELAGILEDLGYTVKLTHRDIRKPVLASGSTHTPEPSAT